LIVADINREVSTDDSTMFATMFLAIVDTRTGRLRYCDGGHCTPYIMSSSGRVEALETKKHLPVGIFADTEYGEREVFLAAGDSLILYTDGITEAENMNGAWFGTEGLLESLSAFVGLNPGDAADRLVDRVQAFAGDKPQSDDIAVMAVKFGKSQLTE
jgi:serine phosphatase RsbU (regulator of sigma subunit)